MILQLAFGVLLGWAQFPSVAAQDSCASSPTSSSLLQKAGVRSRLGSDALLVDGEEAGHMVNRSAVATIEQRVIAGRTRQQHRQRVNSHLESLRLGQGVLQQLQAHMESGRLALWDPDDKYAVP
eukprot:CAMPEP_0204522558 /NCGR_PEP_ID=MMETSP0661-20131031/6390_1 /ASSEMBLY_ACC=CAM_ASM_000606 /TAXON_ID=109239 /ORGANISM="Alexandrium margalefi, Strain AMGDE01CS-322" /LENGTH=123 /DNA_ID=CAMNT_0051528239 /DNA_START=85 /DNA_END=453 /DNA_ORIENTATION=+